MSKVIGYLRLSRDDGDDAESTSIVNQRKIIQAFADSNGIVIDDYYVDDGYSGYTTNRPSWNRLMRELNESKVHTVIAKDLSRIGRNNAQVNLFLDNIYEEGKRVIAIGDSYDTYNEKSHEMVGIHTWMNDKYVKDVSKKVRASIETMQKEGRWVSSLPYGYMHDPIIKGKYYIDPTCAHYVKDIFDMYIDGMGIKLIARKLTEDGVPTHNIIRRNYIEREGRKCKLKIADKWDMASVKRILSNEFYCGTLVQRKTKRRSINGKQVPVDINDQYIHENAHEAIIDKQTFDLVQEISKERSVNHYRGKRIQTRTNIFSGVTKCADCGERMTTSGSLANTRYVCITYNRLGNKHCTSHAILESDLRESLLVILEHCKNNLAEVLKDIDIIMQQDNERFDNEDILKTLQSDLKRIKEQTFALMEQKMRETMANPSMAKMIDDMYSEMINSKYIEIASLEKQISDKQITVDESGDIKTNLKTALDMIDEVLQTEKLTKKQVLLLVDHIDVHNDGGLDIYLKGDLHAICNNHINISQHEHDKIMQTIVEQVLVNPNKTIPTNIWRYVKSLGHSITYSRYRREFFDKMLETNSLQILGERSGYKLIVDKDELYINVGLNNVTNTSPCYIHNSVTIETIKKISAFGYTLIVDNNKQVF